MKDMRYGCLFLFRICGNVLKSKIKFDVEKLRRD